MLRTPGVAWEHDKNRWGSFISTLWFNRFNDLISWSIQSWAKIEGNHKYTACRNFLTSYPLINNVFIDVLRCTVSCLFMNETHFLLSIKTQTTFLCCISCEALGRFFVKIGISKKLFHQMFHLAEKLLSLLCQLLSNWGQVCSLCHAEWSTL